MRIWIDLANSPHPLLFAPLARRLEASGASVCISARDNAQTVDLARQEWERVRVIGGESPPGRAAKARALAERIRALVRFAREVRPDVALSHNSYAQTVAARLRGIPVVTAMDFEHQPANHVAFRAADRILLPEAIPLASVRRQGARTRKIVRYPGLKEELYLADFVPDEKVLDRLGIDRSNGGSLVVARSAPDRATYHRFGNPLFRRCLEVLADQEDVVTVVLPRHEPERRELQALGLSNLLVPETTVDTRSLLQAADMMLGAGGTMTREAALMGVPTYSVFAGTRPAVDDWLERRGALRRLTDPAELSSIAPRSQPPATLESLRERARRIEDVFIETTMALGRTAR